MAVRHLFLRFTPRLDGRWLIALLVVGALVGAATYIRWSGPAPPLDLVALGPEGRFADTLRIPGSWGDTATHTPEAVVRVPLILGVRNLGQEPVSPGRLSLSVPLRYRITDAEGWELDGHVEAGSPLVRYTLDPGLEDVQPQRLPTLLPAHDTLWLEVVVPSFYCVAVGDSIPEFVAAPPPPIGPLSDVRIFYSFEGGDLTERRTGTLAVRIDTALLDVDLPDSPPTFSMETDPGLARPELGSLQRVGSRRSLCGEPESPMELLSTVWETASGGRFITLDYGGTVRKHLYDLDGDGVIERESWAPAGDGRFTATRRARLPVPAFLLPTRPGGDYPLARFDSLSPDSLARGEPWDPGPTPSAAVCWTPAPGPPGPRPWGSGGSSPGRGRPPWTSCPSPGSGPPALSAGPSEPIPSPPTPPTGSGGTHVAPDTGSEATRPSGEETMNERQRKKIEERLLEERQERVDVLADLDERFKDRLEQGDGDLTNYPLHMADDGTDTMEQEKEFLLAHQEGEQLIAIDEALRRLYKTPESFGTCEECGGEIGMERLEMVPWATLCISCRKAKEQLAGAEGPAS